jgi:hypothetical protein
VHLSQVLKAVGLDRDPVFFHRISAGPVSLQVLGMPRRVDILEPLGDPELERALSAGGKKEVWPAQR